MPSKEMQVVLNEFGSYYAEMVAGEKYESPDDEDYDREDRLRVSGFPYCGLRHAFNRLDPDRDQRVSFGMKYYCSVGTVTHRYIQFVMGHGFRMLGKWKCPTKGCPGTGEKVTRKNRCPHCKRPMDYEELTVKHGNHLSGHLDGIYKSKDGRYWLIDYKTSSKRAIRFNKVTGDLPYAKNVAQIKAYCALIEETYDIEISGWILVYVARDNPMKFFLPIGEEIKRREKKRLLKIISTYDDHYGTVMTARKWVSIQKLIDEKPCKTQEDYLASDFHDKFKPCPLGAPGVCFNPQLLKQVMRNQWASRDDEWLTWRRPKYFDSKPSTEESQRLITYNRNTERT